MSATQTPVMNPEQAFEVLTTQVHAPVFFRKLASDYGVTPQSYDEARTLLHMAGQLRNVHERETEKAAAINSGLIGQAKQDLDAALTNHGYPELAQNHVVKRAAHDLANNDLVREAAIVFQHYLNSK